MRETIFLFSQIYYFLAAYTVAVFIVFIAFYINAHYCINVLGYA